MTAVHDRSERMKVGESGAARGFRWVAALTAVLVLIQALLAGQGMFADPGLLATHGWVGNATFLAAIALVALAYVAGRRGALGRLELWLSILLLVLVIAQLGLGYSGRESTAAASLHIPNGVLIFGLTAAVLALSLPRRSTTTP